MSDYSSAGRARPLTGVPASPTDEKLVAQALADWLTRNSAAVVGKRANLIYAEGAKAVLSALKDAGAKR